MLVSILALLVGCIHVPASDCHNCDSGLWEQEQHECLDDRDCLGDQACITGSCEFHCSEDAQCDGNMACQSHLESHTDELGCAQRCVRDDDCKGGTNCQFDGSCE